MGVGAKRCSSVLAALLAMALPPHAAARDEPPVLSFQSENDLYGDAKDRWYSNGFRLAFDYPAGNEPEIFSWVQSLLPTRPPLEETDVFFAIGQNMYTPEDIKANRLIEDDRPYAGWLYLEVGVSGGSNHLQETFTLSLGVTGPPSLAKRTQKFVHEITNSPDPQGWEFQLDTEVTAQAYYERAWFFPLGTIAGETRLDISPRLGADLGTAFVDANGGVVLRIGNYLPAALPPRINPSATGAGKILRPGGSGLNWYIFGGFEARGVARNLFLDGSTFENSHSVAKEELVYEWSAGVAMSFGPFALSYSFVRRSEEFELQRESQAFGSINVSVAF